MEPLTIIILVLVPVAQFLWARYSRLARTRASVVIVAIGGSLLLALLWGMRASMVAALVGESLGSRDFLTIGLFVLGYFGGTTVGWVARQHNAVTRPPG